MSTKTATGIIRITKVPVGEPPLFVRKAWVSLELPCEPMLGFLEGGEQKGVLSGDAVSRGKQVFQVPQDEAITILVRSNFKVAKYWMEKGFPKPGEYFCFGIDEAEILEGVTSVEIREVPKEAQGHLDR